METLRTILWTKMSESGKVLKKLINTRYKEAVLSLREFRENAEWIAQQREALREKYPNRYIAVRRRQVVEDDEDLSELLRKIREKYGEADDIAIDYISLQRIKLLL
jgi:hypothetical protein